MKKMIAMLAMLAMAAPAMAADTDDVLVNIEVAEEVQLWSNDASVDLVLEGQNMENSDVALSSLSIINNVDARIDALVTGALPTPIVAGGGIQFFLFPNPASEAAVYSAIAGNAYAPAGAQAWNQAALGTTKTVVASTGINTSIANVPVAYAAAAPGELPLPNDFQLTVTWTIVDNNP